MNPLANPIGFVPSFVILLSGAATLVLEIAWIRQLGLTLGRTHAALATITAAFLAGLAGGAWLAARALQPRIALIRTHLAAGAIGVAFPVLARGVDVFIVWLAGVVGSGGAVFAVLAHGSVALLVLVPAMLLGSGLPLVLAACGSEGPRRAGWLAGVSALGAALGSLGTAFALLPALGTIAAGRVGAVLALAAGFCAVGLRTVPAVAEENWGIHNSLAQCASRTEPANYGCPNSPGTRVLWLACTCGALGMILELSWLRYFTLVLGSTTFAFALILAGYVGGSAMGALAADRWLARRRRAAANLLESIVAAPGVAAVCAGLAVLFIVPLLGQLPVWLIGLHASSIPFEAQQLALFAITTLTMLAPAMALGAVFPLATAHAPRRAGSLIAAGTTGSVLATLAFGGLVLPLFGLQRTLTLCALALVGSGTAWCAGRLAGVSVSVCALLFVQALMPVWKPAVLASGAYHYAATYEERARRSESGMEAALDSFGRILAYRDCADGSVAVRQQPDGTRSLVIDGKADASTMGDMRTQRLLGHLPAILAGGRNGLVIGLGSGVTAGSLLSYPFDNVDVVELSPVVVSFAAFFSADSRAPLADGRARLAIQDARAFLSRSRSKWDVITSEPTNPWVAGSAALFTREFFLRCRDSLMPDGLMCQWVPAYHQTPDEFRAIVSGFRQAFPHATLWESTRGLDYLLVARQGPLTMSMKRFAAAFADRQVASDLAEVEIRDERDLLSRFVCGPEGIDQIALGVEPISDDRMELEFSGPRSRRQTDGAKLIARRVAAQRADVASFLVDAPRRLALDIKDRWMKEEALDHLRGGRVEEATRLLVQATENALSRGQRPAYLKGFFLASVRDRVSRGDMTGARSELDKLSRLLPDDPDLENERGQLLVQSGAFADARAIYERLSRAHPTYVHAWRNLALTSLMTEDKPTAIRAARRALSMVPHEPELLNLLGRALYQQGHLRDAMQQYTRAMALDPSSAESRVGIAMVASALGHDPDMVVQ